MHGNFLFYPITHSSGADKNLRVLGGLWAEEQRFAKAIAGSFIDGSRLLGSQEAITRFPQSMGSTDV